MSDRYGSHRDS